MCWERSVAPRAVRPTCSALRHPARAFFVAGALILLALLLGACGRAQSAASQTKDDYQVSFATDPAPPNQGAGAVIVTVKDKQGKPVDGARVAVEANMNHAGMTPENANTAEGANGVYRMPLNWSMGGAWYVDVSITLPSGEVLRRRFPVDVK